MLGSERRTGHVGTKLLGDSDPGGLRHICDTPLPEKFWLPSVSPSVEDILGPSGQGTIILLPLFAAVLDEAPVLLSGFPRLLFEVFRDARKLR